MPPLMIGVWDAETRLSLAARASDDGNEVKATLEVLKSLDLKGCIVTADALHRHPKMAEGVLARGGHRGLKLEGNNAPLRDCAISAFARAEKRGAVASCEKNDKGHERFGRRRVSVVAAPEDTNLPGLVMFGRIESERRKHNGQTATFVYYVAASKRLSPRKLMEVNREHWGVENKLHWPLDVFSHEDDARSRKNSAPQSLSFIRRMAINISTIIQTNVPSQEQ